MMDNASCPIVAGVPDVMKAAFTKEVDFFATRGIEYLDPALTFIELKLTARRMFETWGPRLGITEDESDHAHREACARSSSSSATCRRRAAPSSRRSRPRTASPSSWSGAPTTPTRASTTASPRSSRSSATRSSRCARSRATRAYLSRYFKEEVGARPAPARHQRRLAGELLGQQRAEGVGGEVRRPGTPTSSLLDLSSFKCGHDAPTYGIVESIVSASATPYAALHDIDANKPGGSIKIRVKTYAHSLKLHEEALEDAAEEARRARP